MLSDLQKLAIHQFEQLVIKKPEQKNCGGQLFIGKHYAKNDILFLGAVPSLNDDSTFNTELMDTNILLESSSVKRHQKNASVAFGYDSELKTKLSMATFSYLCPFRVAKWNDVNKLKQDTLLEYSRPILNKILTQCQPKYIIVSGMYSIDILLGHYPDIFTDAKELEMVTLDRPHRWSEYGSVVNGQPVRILKAPNFSYASNKNKLREFSHWLSHKIDGSL